MPDQDPAPHQPLNILERINLISWPIALTLAGIFLVSFLLLALSEFSVRATREDAREMAGALQRLEASAELRAIVVDAETGQRGFLLTLDSRFLKPFEASAAALDGALRTLRDLSPSPDLQQRIDSIEATARERLAIASLTISLMQTGESAQAIGAVRDGTGKDVMDEFREQLRSFDQVAQAEVNVLRERQARAAMWPRLAALISTILALTLVVVVYRLQIRRARHLQADAVASAREAERMHRLVDDRTAELSDLSAHLQTVAEREKAELARNLHDELGGLLTAARMDLSWVQGATQGLDGEIRDKLLGLNTALQEAMDIKRRVVESLRPALLDHFGLPTALQSHFDETCGKAGLNCTTSVPEDFAELPPDVAIALFRIGQEALTNIIRHARASNVHLQIEASSHEITVTVKDDGVGMDVAAAGGRGRGSHGLAGMRERVASLGGVFELESAPARGTTIRIRVPLVTAR